MKKIFRILVLVPPLFCACTQSPEQKNGDTALGQPKKSLPKYFYKRLQGTIADQPVVVELQRTNLLSAGVYRYQNQGRNIVLHLDTVINQDSLVLREYVLGDRYSDGRDATLGLKWTGTGFKGTFTNKKGNKSKINIKEAYPSGSYKLSPDSTIAEMPAFRDKPEPKATIAYQYLNYQGKNSAWLNNNLKASLGITNGADWKTGLKTEIDDYFKNYKEQVKDYKAEANEPPPYYLNYEATNSLYVKFNEKDFLVTELMNYSYTGGAHGNYGSSFNNYDIAQQKVLKLADLLTDTVILQPLIEKYFRQQQGLKINEPLSKVLFDDEIKLNNNFYINGQGFTFLYNPYEIASYAQGQIEVFVPYSALKQQLTPWFKTRLAL